MPNAPVPRPTPGLPRRYAPRKDGRSAVRGRVHSARLGRPAGHAVHQLRRLPPAALEGQRAARVEGAAAAAARSGSGSRPARACARGRSCRGRAPRRAACACRDGAGRRRASRAAAISTSRPQIHHADARRHVPDHGEVVADEEVGQAQPVLQVAHQVEDLRLHGDVERRGRLVADDEVGLGRQRAGDGDALALAAGELVRVLRAVGGVEADEPQQLADAVRGLALRPSAMPKARIGSAMMSPTRQRGLRLAKGSWKIIWMRRRSLRRCGGVARWRPSTRRRCAPPRRSGGSRPTTMRATVDLPEPDSPTSAKVSPLAMVKETPSTARSSCRPSRASVRSSQGRETSKSRRRPSTSTSGVSARGRSRTASGSAALMRTPPARRPRRRAKVSRSGSSARKQATAWSPLGSSGGRSTTQRAKAWGQRGWKAQPGGMAVSRGMEPGICTSRSRRRLPASGSRPSGRAA